MAEYIEREALRDALYEADAITMRGVAIINQFPTADVREVVHGKWIAIIPYNSDYRGFKCNKCGAQFQGIHRDNFCGNCGADMRGTTE